jgi:hypothetical protein
MPNTRAIFTAALLFSIARPADGGPITFLTALPVAQGQAVVRGQYGFVRATGDPTPAERELTIDGMKTRSAAATSAARRG